MQKKININNKKLKTSILIKKNFIEKFVKNIAKKNEKVFCIIDSKIRNNLNINRSFTAYGTPTDINLEKSIKKKRNKTI